MRQLSLVVALCCSLHLSGQNKYPVALKDFVLEKMMTKNFFVFKKNGKVGVVSQRGKVVLPAEYNYINSTKFNLFAVVTDKGNGVVDKNNNFVCPPTFTSINILSAHRFHAARNTFYFIISDKNQFLKDTSAYPSTIYTENGIDYMPPAIEVLESLPLPNTLHFQKDNTIFLVKKGDTIKTNYENIYPLTTYEDLFKYQVKGRWGIIDQEGIERWPAVFEDIFQDYHTNLLIAKPQEGKVMLLKPDLSVLDSTSFDDISPFNKNRLSVFRRDSTVGIMRADATVVFKPMRGEIMPYEDCCFLINNYYDTTFKRTIVDSKMKSILPEQTIVDGYEGRKILIRNSANKKGIYHAAGYPIIPCTYDDVFFGNTDGEESIFFKAQKNGKWGVLNSQQDVVVPFAYDKIGLFDQGLSILILKGKYGVIDEKNNIIIPFKYDHADYKFNKLELLRMEKNKFYGFINKKGKTVIPFVYEHVDEDFEGGLNRAKQNGKWGFIDSRGQSIIPFLYDEVQPFYGETTTVKKGNTTFRINKKGELIQ